MTRPFAFLPPVATCALLLTGCGKPELDPKIIEAQKANTDAQCACVKDPDYAACFARANTEHPKPKLEDGFKTKYSDESVKAHHEQIVLANECAKTADIGALPQ